MIAVQRTAVDGRVTGFRPWGNFLCWRLLDPAARELYVDWDEATDVAVSGLREAAGSDPDDPRLRSLIDELPVASERFRELWARADVATQWASSTCATRRSVICTGIGTDSTFRTPAGSTHADLSRGTRQPVRQGARGTANPVRQPLTRTHGG
jgi:hypothetical protein